MDMLNVMSSNDPESHIAAKHSEEDLPKLQLPSFSALSRELVLADIPGNTKENFLDCYFPIYEGLLPVNFVTDEEIFEDVCNVLSCRRGMKNAKETKKALVTLCYLYQEDVTLGRAIYVTTEKAEIKKHREIVEARLDQFISLGTSHADQKLQTSLKEAIAQTITRLPTKVQRHKKENLKRFADVQDESTSLSMKPKVKEEDHELTVDAGSRRSTRRVNYIQRDIEKEFDRFLRTHEGEDEELIATDFAFMFTLQDLLHYAEERSHTMNNRLAYKSSIVVGLQRMMNNVANCHYEGSIGEFQKDLHRTISTADQITVDKSHAENVLDSYLNAHRKKRRRSVKYSKEENQMRSSSKKAKAASSRRRKLQAKGKTQIADKGEEWKRKEDSSRTQPKISSDSNKITSEEMMQEDDPSTDHYMTYHTTAPFKTSQALEEDITPTTQNPAAGLFESILQISRPAGDVNQNMNLQGNECPFARATSKSTEDSWSAEEFESSLDDEDQDDADSNESACSGVPGHVSKNMIAEEESAAESKNGDCAKSPTSTDLAVPLPTSTSDLKDATDEAISPLAQRRMDSVDKPGSLVLAEESATMNLDKSRKTKTPVEASVSTWSTTEGNTVPQHSRSSPSQRYVPVARTVTNDEGKDDDSAAYETCEYFDDTEELRDERLRLLSPAPKVAGLMPLHRQFATRFLRILDEMGDDSAVMEYWRDSDKAKSLADIAAAVQRGDYTKCIEKFQNDLLDTLQPCRPSITTVEHNRLRFHLHNLLIKNF